MKKFLYYCYVIRWYVTHLHPVFKNCCPACYKEWHDWEFESMLENIELYHHCWYYPILRYYQNK